MGRGLERKGGECVKEGKAGCEVNKKGKELFRKDGRGDQKTWLERQTRIQEVWQGEDRVREGKRKKR